MTNSSGEDRRGTPVKEATLRPCNVASCHSKDRKAVKPDVKGFVEGYAALSIHPHRRYVVVKLAAGFTRLPP